jgi:hypothetical protein
MRRNTFNNVYEYLGSNGYISRCHLALYETPNEPMIVIASEIPDNPGQSITNAAAVLATDVFRMFNGPKEGLIWIERYPKDGDRPIDDERYSMVSFDFSPNGFTNPKWRYIPKAEVIALVEQAYAC